MQNTVKFNLKKALANPELVVYRNGKKPKEWHWFRKANQNGYCIYSVIGDGNVTEHIKTGDNRFWDSYTLVLLSEPKRKPAKKK